jgi:hypothetical protein
MAGAEEELLVNVIFCCFSNTDLIVLGGYNGNGNGINLVENYNMQTGTVFILF